MTLERDFKKTLREDTIRKILKKAGYHGRVTRKKPRISAVNTEKRLDFANEHVNKSPQFWEKVLFSDESKFCMFGLKGRKLVWRKRGTALEKVNLVPKAWWRWCDGLGVHGNQWRGLSNLYRLDIKSYGVY
ncbi:transposable element Tc1 transposase [Trichonephila clavipes]|nr:transposable element Tc1 transposase [Trichonephila clavipes]